MLRLAPWLTVLALAALMGCARETTTTTEERTEYQRTTESRLEQLRAEIDTLNAKTREAGAELKAELEERVRALEAQRDSTEQKLAELREAGDRTWQDVKEGTDRMLERLEMSIADTRARLQSRADST
jgi:uncharacterized coiled-coil DUF342 family protein